MTVYPIYDPLEVEPEREMRKIIIADSNAFERHVMTGYLTESGYEVVSTADMRGALELARQYQPELVMIGVHGKDSGGIGLCAALKQDAKTSNLYVLLLAEGKKDDLDLRTLALETGADDCISTPCNLPRVLSAVRMGLKISGLQRLLGIRNEDHRQLTNRMDQELTVVSNIQKAMLPQEFPRTSAYDFTSFYLPSSECGGDYYDLIQLDDKHQGFVIADVSGHGAPAMVAMALIRQNFHIFSRNYKEPNLLLEELNRLLFDHLPTEQYATMFYMIIDTETMECSYASAGHTPPIFYQAATQRLDCLRNCEGFPLKLVMRDVKYPATSIKMNTGDKVIFYTDGVTECFNSRHELYGSERLLSVIQENRETSPRQLETAIVTDVMCFADDHPMEDDVTLAILGVN